MSKFDIKTMKCNICGREQEVTVLAMATQHGTADLDFRPPEVRRSAMPLWVHRCDYCRNVFSTSEPMPEYDEKYIDSQEYTTCGGIASLPETGKLFVKEALIYRHVKEYLKAGNCFLYAAWTCDDEKLDVIATVCRKKALDCYNEVDGSTIPKRQIPQMVLRIIDMQRRCGLFDDAIGTAEQFAFKNEQYEKMRRFQIEKANAQDKRCYRLEDIA
ncbi:MAG: hypothetical protein K6G07_03285 [Lachnospiraceae bacterium]|nr:hypothetical protein [Lachnospiraceae bacterium]